MPEPQPEVQTPWEFKIKRMKEIFVPARTLNLRFNYWIVEEDRITGELHLKSGYHSKIETGNEVILGELVCVNNENYTFVPNPGQLDKNPATDRKIRELVLPKVLEIAREEYKIEQPLFTSALNVENKRMLN